ncbi:MAG TPA: endonuclease/exonuclease/phosphatase family protein [Kofleriaceae bacterium]|nr:endonuclease/exonuclease/phosphatase family protein [Kofleriaceae bacterium]
MASPYAGPNEQRLKLLTFNTWGRTGPWAKRRALIVDGIRALAPDVVGLNEVWDDADGNLADELATALGGTWHVHHAPAYELAPGRTCGNAILARHPIEGGEGWRIPEPKGDTGRNLVHGVVVTPWGRLPVFVTHLSWMFHQSAARLLQLQQVRAWIGERAPIERGEAPSQTLPPVLMGDMNAEPESDEIRFVRGLMADPTGFYMADCFAIRGEGTGHTWHRDNVYAAREHYPDRRLDYIFVRAPDRWHRGEPLACRVVLDEPREGVFASDHYGVYAEIRATPITLPPL